ncbi:MAG TPA: MCE family protein [Marmoricola sp.]|nr:MCE family protein [Marmoricola sp.]HNI70389.1 MCE family protein [Marmoricola sp.]HNJ78143.1 MCE family protein [Marmoricola sp.]HNN47708.1 MCE family protein [Marmoricola sp.]
MKALNQRDPFKLGLIALLIGGLLVGAVVVISVIPFGEKGYTAFLAQTAGLRVGENVNVAGVPSGKVRSIALDGDQVKVEFSLDKDVKLGSETAAEVKVATLLGTHYLEVVPKGSGELKNGTIPLDRTSVPFNLQDVLEKSAQTLDAIDPAIISQAMKSFSENTEMTKDDIGPALTGLARLSEMVAARKDQLAELMAATREVTDQLSANSDDLIVMMDQANLVLAEITKRREAIHAMLVATTELSKNINRLISETNADMGPAFTKANQVIDTLRAQDAVMKNLLSKTAPAARYLANANGSGPWTNVFVRYPAIPADDGR